MSTANERQVGGDHYRKTPGEQHWDRAVRLRLDFFQYMITKYIERCRDKNQKQDVEKALHFCQKYVESWEAMGYPTKQVKLTVNLDEDLKAAALGNAQALDWLLEHVIMTPEGKITLPDGGTYTCLKGTQFDFTREGAYGDGRVMWTCKACRGKVYTRGEVLPQATHKCGEEKAVMHAKPDDNEGLDAAHVHEVRGDKHCSRCDQLAVPAACIRDDCPHKPRVAVRLGGEEALARTLERRVVDAVAEASREVARVLLP